MANKSGRNGVITGKVKKLHLQTPQSTALEAKERNVTTLERMKKQHWRDTDIEHPKTGWVYWATQPHNPTLRCF
jgi:hypothetical protein